MGTPPEDVDALRKERRRFEEDLRRNLLILSERGLIGEARALLDRLRSGMVERMSGYLKA